MKESDLILILKSFSPAESKEFEKFISSPFFNKGRNLLPYYRELVKILPKYDNLKHDQSYFYKILYPVRQYDSKAKAYINKLSSELLKLADEYFMCRYNYENPEHGRIALHEILKEKNIYTYSLKKINSGKIKTNEIFDPESYYQNLYVLNSLEAGCYLAANKLKNYCVLFESRPLLFTANFLVQFWLAIIQEINFIFQFNHDINSIKTIKQIISPEAEEQLLICLKKENTPGIENAVVYYYISRAYRNLGNENLYTAAMNSVFKQLDNFDHKTKFNLLLYLEGITVYSEKVKNISWNKHRYDIVKTMLSKGIYSHKKNQIYYLTYDNIVKVLITQGKYSETEKFIDEFSHLLPSNLRTDCENGVKAWLFFAKKKFGKALNYNSRIKNDIFNQATQSKLLEILCHFEMKEYELSLIACNKLKKYLSENKTMSVMKNRQYYNFISAIKLLTDIIYKPAVKTNKHKFEFLLNSDTVIYRKEWLLKKAEELETGGAAEK